MVDIHSHIIWGIDDGSKSEEMTLELLQQAVKSGTKHIIATPHFTRGYFEVPFIEVKKYFNNLKTMIKNNNLDIKVHLGQEVYYKDNLIEHYQNGDIGTINDGKYMLLELPMRDFNIDKVLDETYELQIKGIKIIIAHPERYIPFIKNPSAINRFIQEGFLFQLNGGSLLGDFNTDVRKLAQKYLDNGIYSFVGSDGHRPDRRSCDLTRTIEYLNKNNEEALITFNDNGIKLVNNKNIEFEGTTIETSRAKGKKVCFLSKILGR